MSTRSGIVFTSKHITGKKTDNPSETLETKHLYHHWDGYIDGVGKDLVEFIKKNEPYYMLDHMIENLPRSYKDTDNVSNHGDLEYVYTVNLDFVENKIEITAYKREHFEKSEWAKWPQKLIAAFEIHETKMLKNDYSYLTALTLFESLTEDGFTRINA